MTPGKIAQHDVTTNAYTVKITHLIGAVTMRGNVVKHHQKITQIVHQMRYVFRTIVYVSYLITIYEEMLGVLFG